MSIVSDFLSAAVSAAARKQANEIDDIIAGLLINGVPREEIEIRQFPDKTIIAVRGVPRYEVKIKFSIKDAIWGRNYE